MMRNVAIVAVLGICLAHHEVSASKGLYPPFPPRKEYSKDRSVIKKAEDCAKFAVALNEPTTNSDCQAICEDAFSSRDWKPYFESCGFEPWSCYNRCTLASATHCYDNWVFGYETVNLAGYKVHNGIESPTQCQGLCQKDKRCFNWIWRGLDGNRGQCIFKEKTRVTSAFDVTWPEGSSSTLDWSVQDVCNLVSPAAPYAFMQCEKGGKLHCAYQSSNLIAGYKYCGPIACNGFDPTTSSSTSTSTTTTSSSTSTSTTTKNTSTTTSTTTTTSSSTSTTTTTMTTTSSSTSTSTTMTNTSTTTSTSTTTTNTSTTTKTSTTTLTTTSTTTTLTTTSTTTNTSTSTSTVTSTTSTTSTSVTSTVTSTTSVTSTVTSTTSVTSTVTSTTSVTSTTTSTTSVTSTTTSTAEPTQEPTEEPTQPAPPTEEPQPPPQPTQPAPPTEEPFSTGEPQPQPPPTEEPFSTEEPQPQPVLTTEPVADGSTNTGVIVGASAGAVVAAGVGVLAAKTAMSGSSILGGSSAAPNNELDANFSVEQPSIDREQAIGIDADVFVD